ncbi:hypothetical protein Trydic_g6531 [Trypoxylus dichotomus]
MEGSLELRNAQFIVNSKGNRCLLYRNYRYLLNSSTPLKFFWLCCGYYRYKCKCRLITDTKGALCAGPYAMVEHNHPPPIEQIRKYVEYHGIMTFEETLHIIKRPTYTSIESSEGIVSGSPADNHSEKQRGTIQELPLGLTAAVGFSGSSAMAKQTPGSKCDTGSKYEVSVMAYIASRLSKTNNVENYRIFCNFDEAYPFDDIVAEVCFKGLEHSQIYAIQVKSGKDKLNINKYVDGYKKIIRQGGLKLGKDTGNDRIVFLYFCSKNPTKNIFSMTTNSGTIDLKLRSRNRTYSMLEAIFNKDVSHELFSEDPKAIDHQNFLENFHLFLNQPNTQRIIHMIKGIWNIDSPWLILLYLDNYFTKSRNGLDKVTFEHELLKIRLSDYIVTPTKAIAFQHEAVDEWNRLTLEQDVTIVHNETNIEQYLYGCILQNIPDVISIDEWNRCVDNTGKLNHDLKDRLKSKSLKAETLRDLIVQAWVDGKTPLLLKVDTSLSPLQEFSHLKKRYVIIDSNVDRRCNEIKSYKMSVFRHLDDVEADKMMKAIPVSLQGRKPVSLYAITNGERKLMVTITCLDIIKLIKPRNAYLKHECLDGSDYMLFIIETANFRRYDNDEYRPNGDNIVIYCEPGKSYEYYCNFRANLKFRRYKIFRLHLTVDHKLTQLPRILDPNIAQDEKGNRGLEGFFIDLHGESVYNRENNGPVPIIGEVPFYVHCKYLPRYLREGSSNQFTTKYSEKLLPEKDVVKESNGKIIIITGEPGIGKTTLLRSLFHSYDSKYYILFIDLARHQADLRKGKLKSFRDLLRFSRDKCRNLPYNYFLHGLYDYTDRLVLIVDAFDEVVATCKEQVEELIQNLQKVSLQKIIIASRLTAADLLIGKVDAKTFKVEGFNQQCQKQCIIDYWNLDVGRLSHVPSEFLTNPLYLNMLKYISENETNLEVVIAWNLYETVVKLKMEDYCRRMEPNVPDENDKRFILTKHEELALKVMFGSNEVTKNFEETHSNRSNFIRLGLIVRYDNEIPVFVHHTFVEFFIAKWLIENVGRNDAKYIYEIILNTRQERILDMYSETLPLHKAVLDEDYNNILRLCRENKRCLLEMDGLGRGVLHLAVFLLQYRKSYILNGLIQRMRREGYDIYMCDKIMKWTWIDYFEKCNRGEKLFYYKCFLISQVYLNYCATHVNSLSGLLQREGFFGCYCSAVSHSSISLIRALLSWKYSKHKAFLELRDMCLHSPTSISRKHLDIELAEEKLDGTHLVCIYGDMQAIKMHIGSGINFNKTDKFNCTPLHYSVMAAQNKEIIGLLLENYGISNLYAGLRYDTTIIHMSIATNDVNITKKLLEYVNGKAYDSPLVRTVAYTPLELAIECENKDAAKVLLTYNSDVDFLERTLYKAVRYQETEIIELLLQHGADPNSVLELAIETMDEDIVQMSLNHKADVNISSGYLTPLLSAMERSTSAIVELLLRNGADSNHVDNYGWTPLMNGIKLKRSKDILQLLLNYNADVNFENEFGETPLCMAIERKNLEIRELLLQNGARVNHVDSSGWTLLIHAVQREDDDIVQMLLNFDADVNMQGEDGVTPLCMAVKTKRADIVQILLEKGADVNCFDGCGISPLMAVVETESTQLAKVLLKNNANVNLKNECGITALYAAAFKRDVAMIELLLERGADSNIIITAEDIFRNAKRTGNVEIVVWLLKNRPIAANDFSRSHTATSIIERVTENWTGINLEDELRTLDQKYCNLMKCYVQAHSNDKLSLAILSLINEPSDGDVVDSFINHVTNHKIVKLIGRIRSNGNYNKNLNSLRILYRYYENRFQLFRTLFKLSDSRIISCLFEDISLNGPSEISVNLLCIAIHEGNTEIIEMLLKRGYAVNKPDPDGFTPLMIAVGKRYRYVVAMLLDYGADVDFGANDSGLTALYIAALIEDLYMVSMLLWRGANKNINTSEDVFKTCMKLAQRYGELNLSAYCTFEKRNRVKDIIEEKQF